MKHAKAKSPASVTPAIVCLPRMLPRAKWVSAARQATMINPLNHPPATRLGLVERGLVITPEHIAVLTTKYWRAGGVHLTVGFMDTPPKDVQKRIMAHMNAWGKTANVKFSPSKTDPQVRIARVENDGYWSYLGTDVLSIPANEPTMNLDSFTMETDESEYHRVVRHETGHTMGFPHEHMRRELVDLIDADKAIRFFGQTQGWDEQMVRAQVLTPLEESSLLGTPHADMKSIMCYQIPGSLTKNGQPIIGGIDIDESDAAFAGQIYPKAGAKKPSKAPVRAKAPSRSKAKKARGRRR